MAWALGAIGVLSFLGLAAHRLLWPGLPILLAMQRPEVPAAPFSTEDHAVPSGARSVPLRVYRPQKPWDRAILLVHGVHRDGMGEARLQRFARDLARAGFLVATPDIEDLRTYELAPRAVDDIEASARYLLDRLGGGRLAHKPGIMGISFAGGLSLSAAARPGLEGRLAYVFSFGGHGDLDRVMAYLASGRLPSGRDLPPHPYGQAVLARRLAARLVPPDQVEPLRAALRLFLEERGAEFQAAIAGLPSEARQVAELCLRFDAPGLAARLAPLVPELRCDPVLSPLRGPAPRCAVFALHGSVDNIIPPTETTAIGQWSGQPDRALVTDLISHVELETPRARRPGLGETWAVVRLLTRALRS